MEMGDDDDDGFNRSGGVFLRRLQASDGSRSGSVAGSCENPRKKCIFRCTCVCGCRKGSCNGSHLRLNLVFFVVFAVKECPPEFNSLT